MTETTCPCCKSRLNVALPLVDLNTNTVAYRDQSVLLEPREAVLLWSLIQRWPSAVSFDSLAADMWGVHEPELYKRNLFTYACRTRKKVAHLDIDITAESKRGYRLHMDGARH